MEMFSFLPCSHVIDSRGEHITKVWEEINQDMAHKMAYLHAQAAATEQPLIAHTERIHWFGWIGIDGQYVQLDSVTEVTVTPY